MDMIKNSYKSNVNRIGIALYAECSRMEYTKPYLILIKAKEKPLSIFGAKNNGDMYIVV